MRKKRIFGPRRSADRWKLVFFAVLLSCVSAVSFSAGFNAGHAESVRHATSWDPSAEYSLHQGYP